MIAWSENILRLEKAQVNGGTAKLIPKDPERTKLFHRAFPMLGTAFMSNPPKQQVFYLENSYDLIDAPGEWYLDEKNHVLYYKPREGESMATAHVVAPRLNTLFSVLGKDTKNKVGYMSFEGLTFAHSNFTRPSEEGVALNHVVIGAGDKVETRSRDLREHVPLHQEMMCIFNAERSIGAPQQILVAVQLFPVSAARIRKDIHIEVCCLQI